MKILLLILVTICLSSCYSTTEITDTTGKFGDRPKNIPVTHVTHFEYNKHKYIRFRDFNAKGVSGYVHDPDCKCYNKITNLDNKQ